MDAVAKFMILNSDLHLYIICFWALAMPRSAIPAVAELFFRPMTWLVTLTLKLDLNTITMNQHAKYLGHRSCSSQHTHTHSRTLDRLFYLDH